MTWRAHKSQSSAWFLVWSARLSGIGVTEYIYRYIYIMNFTIMLPRYFPFCVVARPLEPGSSWWYARFVRTPRLRHHSQTALWPIWLFVFCQILQNWNLILLKTGSDKVIYWLKFSRSSLILGFIISNKPKGLWFYILI